MAKQTFNKGAHIVVLKKNTTIEKMGLNSENCEEVFTSDPPYRSWVPGRSINQIYELKQGDKLLIKLLKPANKLSSFVDHEQV